MAFVPIPQTRTRLKGFVQISTVPGGAFVADPDQIRANLNQLTVIGAAQVLEIEQTRDENQRRWEFKPTGDAMDAVETVPGRSVVNATLERVDLYDSHLLESLGFVNVGYSITQQHKPIILVVEQPVPTDTDGNPLVVYNTEFKRRTFILPGCWLNNLPLQYNITEGNQIFAARVDLTVRTIQG